MQPNDKTTKNLIPIIINNLSLCYVFRWVTKSLWWTRMSIQEIEYNASLSSYLSFGLNVIFQLFTTSGMWNANVNIFIQKDKTTWSLIVYRLVTLSVSLLAWDDWSNLIDSTTRFSLKISTWYNEVSDQSFSVRS